MPKSEASRRTGGTLPSNSGASGSVFDFERGLLEIPNWTTQRLINLNCGLSSAKRFIPEALCQEGSDTRPNNHRLK